MGTASAICFVIFFFELLFGGCMALDEGTYPKGCTELKIINAVIVIFFLLSFAFFALWILYD